MSSILKSSKYLEVTYGNIQTNYPLLLAKWIKKNIFNNEVGRFLDVGCGNGDYLKAFSKIGYDVKGVDISPSVNELLFPADQVDLESKVCLFYEKDYNYIFTKSVIEHVRNVDNLMESIYNSLRKDGKAVIMSPSWEYTYFGPFFRDHTHITPFTKESLENILRMHGFRNVKVDYFYQLPFVWKYPFMKYFCKLINWFKIPYKQSKLVKFSREVMLLAQAEK